MNALPLESGQALQIVTDSYARFVEPAELAGAPLTILPNYLEIDGRRLREHANQPALPLMKSIQSAAAPAQLRPPTQEDYARLFTHLGMNHPAILSIHAATDIAPTYSHAQAAAQALHGHCEITLLDSKSVSVMQGLLVETACAAIRRGVLPTELIPTLRGMTQRLYCVFLVEELSTLRHQGYLSLAHTFLSEMHDLRVLVSVEDGHIQLIEKARTRSVGVDLLVDYVLEFEGLECAFLLQSLPEATETTRALRERLACERPGLNLRHVIYGAALATHIGMQATGIALLEKAPQVAAI